MKGENVHVLPWTTDTTYALGLCRLLGRALGIWPLECHKMPLKIRSTFIIITQLWMAVSLMKSFFIRGHCGRVTDLVDALSVIVSGSMAIVKVIMPRIYQRKMNDVVNSAIEDWFRVNDKRSRDIMLRYATIGRTVLIVQMLGGYATGFPLIVSRLPFVKTLWSHQTNSSDVEYDVPLGPSCWVSTDITTYHYVAYYTLQCIQLFVVCTVYVGSDTYFFVIAMHVSGQYELLYISLERLNCQVNVTEQKLMLSQFVKRHLHLLNISQYFEDAYNLIILGQVLSDTLLACVSGIVLLMNWSSRDLIIVVGLMIRVYVVCIQLLIYCYVGEQLSTKAEQVQTAIYNVSWYNITPTIRKDIRFIIMRSNYPLYITAGRMYVMNFENFKNIIRSMGSYFSVLRLMFIENK